MGRAKEEDWEGRNEEGKEGDVPSSRTSMMAIEGFGLGDWARIREDRAVAVMRGKVAIVVVMAEAVVSL